MDREKIERQVLGRRIKAVIWQDRDSLTGKPVGADLLLVRALQLEDGPILVFEGSGKIERTEVWLNILFNRGGEDE